MMGIMNVTLEECKSLLEQNGYVVTQKSSTMNENELELLEYLVRNASYTSNEFGKNQFEIDNAKSFKENLEILIETVGKNGYSHAEYNERESYDY